MKKATIIIGSSASMTEELIKRYGFIVVPFKIDWPEEESLLGKNLFEKMRDAEEKGVITTPKTSQPSIGLFKNAFDEGLSAGENVICITISSKISGAFNAAMQARKMFDDKDQEKIFIIDSYNADTAESLLAIEAAKMTEEGQDIKTIIKHINDMIPKLCLYGMTENFKWLEAGGRISHATATILNHLQKIGIRPVLSMIDGLVKPANIKIRAHDTASVILKQLGSCMADCLDEEAACEVAISHADNLSEAQRLRTLIEEKYPKIKVSFISLTNIVIGAHIGPGTIICCTLRK